MNLFLYELFFQLRLSLFSCFVYLSCAQYGPQYLPNPQQDQGQQAAAPVTRHYAPDPYAAANRPVTPQPVILTHKQALTHDGGFNYVFAADNGLQQGESIAPDGTRKGGYSYVDPSGKKISIKYTAGKDGFRIVEGDHVPRAPQPVAQPAPQQAAYQPQYAPRPALQPAYSAPQSFVRRPNEDDGQYRPEEFQRPLPQYVPLPAATATYKGQVSQANALRQEPDYNDEPGKPHSFGAGYTFEFSG